MNKKERVHFIATTLDEFFPHPEIPLKHQDPYTLLIAVLLSAQCTDARVNLVTPKLFAKAKTPKEMIKLTPEEIQEIIRPCGLSRNKARAIWQLSHDILTQHKGKVPKS